MAFLKYASFNIEARKQSSVEDWNTYRSAFNLNSKIEINKIAGLEKFNPNDYLLTHNTIIASVDVEDSKDWLIKPRTAKWVNQNGDAWERKLLLATFRSFIGAHNAIEHIQIFPAMSKGRVVDAVARDIGDSVYVDILVATEKKHASLCEKIASGELATLSMGCGLEGTPITMADGGFKPIEQIAVGDLVLTHKGRPRKVTRLFSHTPLAPVPLHTLHIAGVRERVSLTSEHPVLIFPRERLVNSDGLLDKSLSNEIEPEWVPISEVKCGDYCVVPRVADYEDSVPEYLTEEFATLLGYYVGDGWLLTSHKYYDEVKKGDLPEVLDESYFWGIGFSFNSGEESYRQEVLDLGAKVFEEGVKAPREHGRPGDNVEYVEFSSKEISTQFFKLAGKGAKTKALSEELFSWPEKYLRAFFRGWANTDGCFYGKNGSVHISSSSKKLLNQLHLLLYKIGVLSRFNWYLRAGTGFSKKPYECGQVDVAKSFLRNLQCDKISWRATDTDYTRERWLSKWGVVSYVRGTTCLHVTEPVFNFSVDEDESYLVGNVAVHNCIAEYTVCSKCGNKAADDEDLCNCVKYEKGNTFIDEDGVKRVVAELCGHHTDPESVRFIEASWVRTPAFTGAVRNKFISNLEEWQESKDSKTGGLAKVASMSKNRIILAKSILIPEELFRMIRADVNVDALKRNGQGAMVFDGENPPLEEDFDPEPSSPENDSSAEVKEELGLDTLVDLDEEKEKTDDNAEVSPVAEIDAPDFVLDEDHLEESVVRSKKYARAIGLKKVSMSRVLKVVKKARVLGWNTNEGMLSGREMLFAAAVYDTAFSSRRMIDADCYGVIAKLGPINRYRTHNEYLNMVSKKLGRVLSPRERELIISRAKIFLLGGSNEGQL